MKKIIGILLFVLSYTAAQAQEAFFLGTYRKKEQGIKYWCQNAGEHTLKPVQNYDEYTAFSKSYIQAHEGEWPYTHYIRANNPFIIYQFEVNMSGFNCNYTTIGYAQAATVEKTYEILKSRQQEYKFIGEPKILHTWLPEKKEISKKVVERNYGELYAKFTLVNSQTINAAVAQFRNQSKTQAAVIVIRRKNEEPDISVIQPGAGANKNLKAGSNYNLEIFFRSKGEVKNSTTIISEIKEAIKSHVIKDADHKEEVKVNKEMIIVAAGKRG